MAVDRYSITIVAVAVVAAGIVGTKTRITSSIFEVAAGILIANILGIGIASWLDFLGTFGGLILTFLAGGEVKFILLAFQAHT
jgi:Kef-type K+ transport system membrane component KefB